MLELAMNMTLVNIPIIVSFLMEIKKCPHQLDKFVEIISATSSVIIMQ
jgi:hypothetical protein